MIRLFERFVDDVAIHADTLYILGDFVEYWIGDDDKALGLEPVFTALDRLHQAGTRIKIMHGNRDFLIGQKLAAQYHFEIINDPYLDKILDQSVLLMHGDLLCTDDIAYQDFRHKVRNKTVQRIFLLLPLFLRERIAKSLRGTSEKATSNKSEAIMDVNQQAVEDTMRETGVNLLIHGHTHRPGIHEFELDGMKVKRIVLGDWYKNGNYICTNANNEFQLVLFN